MPAGPTTRAAVGIPLNVGELLAPGTLLHIPSSWWPDISTPTPGHWEARVLRVNNTMRDSSKKFFIRVDADAQSGTGAYASWHYATELLPCIADNESEPLDVIVE